MLADAVRDHQPSHLFALFSGGHDSLVSTHLASRHPAFNGVVHINTGIGVEQTRDYVRQTCDQHGWLLLEYHPDGKTYEQLVAERGMPYGPRSHSAMYYWLKQRQVRRLVAEHKQQPGDRIGLVTGIRRSESQRRMESVMGVPVRRIGAQLWLNPIIDWSARDCHDYIERHQLERNEVADVLHRSAECLCGALADQDEIWMLEWFYPEAAAEIHRLEQVAAANGQPAKWAHRHRVDTNDDQLELDGLELCHGCQVRAGQ
jgi:3'-phosphoadenosine 5'-phosphosulfate sulfotransferase (PAPS reductase)/FAD synthetase